MCLGFTSMAEKLLVANCKEGEGCTFELTDIDAGLWAHMDEEPVQKDEIVILGQKKDGTYVTYRDKRSMNVIDRQWGGDGYAQLALFNPHIQPKDGLWKAEYGTPTGGECYGIGNMGAFMRKHIGSKFAGQGDVKFEFPFNPHKLFPSTSMSFVKTGYNTYKGVLGQQSGPAAMGMTYYITVVSPELIQTEYHINLKVPTKPVCQGKIPVIFKLLREKKPAEIDDDDLPEDDLLPVNPKGKKDDLLPVESKGDKDDLLPVEPGKPKRTHVPRVDQTEVPRIED